jgi:glycerol dehydrogenase
VEKVTPPGIRVFSSPLRYVQGPGAIDEVGRFAALRHSRAALLVDAALADLIEPRLRRSVERAGVTTVSIPVSGEVTPENIDRLSGELDGYGPDVIIAAGGGKTLDLGKGVSRSRGVPVITVPTIASNDGPTSRVIAQYDGQHRLVATPVMTHNPEAVIVDTALINGAPARFLLSGIGDATAKYFEATATLRSGGLTSHSTLPLMLPLAITQSCYSTLLRDAAAALDMLGSPDVSRELENVVEAVVLMSGLGFESGGLSIAHAMTRGLMIVEGASAHLHGYHVAYGLLVQLRHEGNETDLALVDELFATVGLPRSLAELDAATDDATLATIAAAAMSAPHSENSVPQADAASLIAAMRAVERPGRTTRP